MEFSMFPLGRGESVGAEVSEIIAMIRNSGHDYQLTAMGSIIETAHLGDALALVERAYEILDRAGCPRAYACLKLDIRQGHNRRLTAKIDSVEARIGKVER